MHLFTLNEHGEDMSNCMVMLDTSKCVVSFPGEYDIPLSDMEARILLELMRAEGAPVSKDRLIRKVWDGYATNDALAHRIASLRSKIGQERVLTVYGYGYRLNL